MLPQSEVIHDMRVHIDDEGFDNSDKYHGTENSGIGNSSTVRPAKQNKATKNGKLNNTSDSKM